MSGWWVSVWWVMMFFFGSQDDKYYDWCSPKWIRFLEMNCTGSPLHNWLQRKKSQFPVLIKQFTNSELLHMHPWWPRTDVPPYLCNRMYLYLPCLSFKVNLMVCKNSGSRRQNWRRQMSGHAANCSFITNSLANAMFNTACLSVISLTRANSWAFICTSSIEASKAWTLSLQTAILLLWPPNTAGRILGAKYPLMSHFNLVHPSIFYAEYHRTWHPNCIPGTSSLIPV